MSRTSDKLAINWQTFAQVGLQLKFAFRMRRKCCNPVLHLHGLLSMHLCCL